MKSILKWTRFFKPENYIDLFSMSGKIDNINIFKKILKDKIITSKNKELI